MCIWPRVPCYICVLICFVFRNIYLTYKGNIYCLLGGNNREESSKFTLIISICFGGSCDNDNCPTTVNVPCSNISDLLVPLHISCICNFSCSPPSLPANDFVVLCLSQAIIMWTTASLVIR